MDETRRKKLMCKATSDLGRPEKCDISELIKAICRITISGSAAHDRRYNEVIRTVKTLAHLREALNCKGFELKRSSVYLHLLSRNHRTIKGKRHMTTAPAKFYKSQNSCSSSCIWNIRLHCLIMIFLWLLNTSWYPPSLVMKSVESKDLTNVAVTYSGATYIGIRCAKHSAWSAFAHFQDMMRVGSLPEFATSFKTDRNEEKKVMIVTFDGGPDENPRYEKIINGSIKYFVENSLDAFFLTTNAPGRSAFSLVERRMVKLNKEMSDVILEHDKFGRNLDAKGVTVDKDFELKNFEYAGRTLAKIWSGLMLDGNPAVAEFIEDDAPVIVGTKSKKWKACRVRQSQYFLIIVKCIDSKCCSRFQSSYLKVVPKWFLPAPLPVVHTHNGIEWAKDEKDATYLSLYQNISLQNASMPAQATKKFPKGIPY